jgi:hypothetical protein
MKKQSGGPVRVRLGAAFAGIPLTPRKPPRGELRVGKLPPLCCIPPSGIANAQYVVLEWTFTTSRIGRRVSSGSVW